MFSIAAFFVLFPVFAAASSAGCGQAPPLKPGTKQAFTIDSSGGSREYIVWLPAKYDQTEDTPLILNYHGHKGTDSKQFTLTQLDDPFFNTDHIVIYPQGLAGTDGESAFSGAPYSQPDVDDIQFTSDLLDHAAEILCIDTTRTFATGKSNGGGFVNYLACDKDISARFTAFAPVAGAYYLGLGADGSDCQPSRTPQPILEIHGYNDSQIKYEGDAMRSGGSLPAIMDWLNDWAVRNGCSSADAMPLSLLDGEVNEYIYPCRTYHYAVYDADHVWESTVGNSDTEKYAFGPSAMNASSVVMNFFSSFAPLAA